MTIISAANFIIDAVFTLIAFRRRDNSKRSLPRMVCSYICLLLTLGLYMNNTFAFLSGSIQRFLIRAVLVFLFIYLSLPIRLITAIYACFYWCTLQTLVQSLFFAPLTYPVFNAAAIFTGNPVWDTVFCIFITLVVKCLFYVIFILLTPLEGMSPVYPIDIVPIFLIAAVDVYAREIAIPLTRSQGQNMSALSNYYLILQAVLIVLLGFMEYSRKVRVLRMQDQIRNLESEALIQNIENNRENARAISALRHDLRNHLISLRLLNREGHTQEIDSYIDSLMPQVTAPRKQYITGNDLADGLLSMKLDPGQLPDVDCQVNLDLSKAGFISNEDLCVILGNALDNAIEACAVIKEGQTKHISVTGSPAANYLLLRFENSCRKMPTLVNGLPMTGKSDSRMHGFGLKNIRNVVDKYEGNLSISQVADGSFVLTIMIPIPS